MKLKKLQVRETEEGKILLNNKASNTGKSNWGGDATVKRLRSRKALKDKKKFFYCPCCYREDKLFYNKVHDKKKRRALIKEFGYNFLKSFYEELEESLKELEDLLKD